LTMNSWPTRWASVMPASVVAAQVGASLGTSLAFGSALADAGGADDSAEPVTPGLGDVGLIALQPTTTSATPMSSACGQLRLVIPPRIAACDGLGLRV
jgi:hypothetical protein